jgi:hypothetical protein
MANQFTTSLILSSVIWIVVILMLFLPMFNSDAMKQFLLPLVVMAGLSLLNIFLVAGA